MFSSMSVRGSEVKAHWGASPAEASLPVLPFRDLHWQILSCRKLKIQQQKKFKISSRGYFSRRTNT